MTGISKRIAAPPSALEKLSRNEIVERGLTGLIGETKKRGRIPDTRAKTIWPPIPVNERTGTFTEHRPPYVFQRAKSATDVLARNPVFLRESPRHFSNKRRASNNNRRYHVHTSPLSNTRRKYERVFFTENAYVRLKFRGKHARVAPNGTWLEKNVRRELFKRSAGIRR